jgi:hypothetical protein
MFCFIASTLLQILNYFSVPATALITQAVHLCLKRGVLQMGKTTTEYRYINHMGRQFYVTYPTKLHSILQNGMHIEV